jgi:L-threonate 2-dehydrogenase
MQQIVAVVAPGNMGAAVGQRLVERGARVVTLLRGRSAATAARAQAAGLEPVEEAALAGVDAILSIVPPGAATALAERLSEMLERAERKPLYVDCNAVSPETVTRIAAVIGRTGAPFVDAGIIGGPPQNNAAGPRFYASGPSAGRFAELTAYGLDIVVLDGPVGAASALKLSYAGVTKGLTALGAAMFLAASRAGVAAELHAELNRSQKALLERFSRALPDMYGKAYRWVAEMEEIARFVAEDPGAARIYEGAARLYGRLAADAAGDRHEIGALDGFLGRSE